MMRSHVFRPGIGGESLGAAILVAGSDMVFTVYWKELGFFSASRDSAVFTVTRKSSGGVIGEILANIVTANPDGSTSPKPLIVGTGIRTDCCPRQLKTVPFG